MIGRQVHMLPLRLSWRNALKYIDHDERHGGPVTEGK
jgi:hypothetical protein